MFRRSHIWRWCSFLFGIGDENGRFKTVTGVQTVFLLLSQPFQSCSTSLSWKTLDKQRKIQPDNCLSCQPSTNHHFADCITMLAGQKTSWSIIEHIISLMNTSWTHHTSKHQTTNYKLTTNYLWTSINRVSFLVSTHKEPPQKNGRFQRFSDRTWSSAGVGTFSGGTSCAPLITWRWDMDHRSIENL